MPRVTVNCDLGHTHVVFKCDVCQMPVDESPTSQAVFLAVWPISQGESARRASPWVVCGPSCLAACDSLAAAS